ncbi:unnamed protein product [Cuscuta campestris]|uniref:Uncharacterized protein n=1 Tax=Cuscuta campestris TaxID=132261 RepID=A0A484K425_9ASTE|nr:unnamed protein product [Cuscuta campestris]
MRNRPINPAWRLICRRYQLRAAAGCGDGDGRRRQWRSGSSTAMSSDWRRCNRRRRMAVVQRATAALVSGEGEAAAGSSATAALRSTARKDAGSGGDVRRSAWRRCNPSAMRRRGWGRRRPAGRRASGGEGQRLWLARPAGRRGFRALHIEIVSTFSMV